MGFNNSLNMEENKRKMSRMTPRFSFGGTGRIGLPFTEIM